MSIRAWHRHLPARIILHKTSPFDGVAAKHDDLQVILRG
jgi:hypothetical protein